MIFLSAICGNVWAEWEKVASGVNSTGYIDRSSIRRLIDGSPATDSSADSLAANTLRAADRSATMSVLIDYPKRPFDGNNLPYLSLTMRNEYHCDEHRFRVLTITSHSGHMGSGTQPYTTDEPSEWEPVPTTSIQKAFWQIACEKRPK